jgi:hypothetical protein
MRARWQRRSRTCGHAQGRSSAATRRSPTPDSATRIYRCGALNSAASRGCDATGGGTSPTTTEARAAAARSTHWVPPCVRRAAIRIRVRLSANARDAAPDGCPYRLSAAGVPALPLPSRVRLSADTRLPAAAALWVAAMIRLDARPGPKHSAGRPSWSL